jgi:hypothetical protein
MATIILDYDTRNVQAKKALDFILSLGIFKTREGGTVKVKAESLSEKRKKIDKIFDNYLVDLSEFKFNRDEANNYE